MKGKVSFSRGLCTSTASAISLTLVSILSRSLSLEQKITAWRNFSITSTFPGDRNSWNSTGASPKRIRDRGWQNSPFLYAVLFIISYEANQFHPCIFWKESFLLFFCASFFLFSPLATIFRLHSFLSLSLQAYCNLVKNTGRAYCRIVKDNKLIDWRFTEKLSDIVHSMLFVIYIFFLSWFFLLPWKKMLCKCCRICSLFFFFRKKMHSII